MPRLLTWAITEGSVIRKSHGISAIIAAEAQEVGSNIVFNFLKENWTEVES